MLIEIVVPSLPESVSEGTLMTWHKKPGDTVAVDDPLIDLETDKVTLEIAAPEAGVIKELLHQPGDVVLTDTVLCIIDTEAAATADSDDAPQAASPSADSTEAAGSEGTPRFGPSVRKLLEEHELDPNAIAASGRDGRLSKADVLAHLEGGNAEEDVPAATTTVTPASITFWTASSSSVNSVVPTSTPRLRLTTAGRSGLFARQTSTCSSALITIVSSAEPSGPNTFRLWILAPGAIPTIPYVSSLAPMMPDMCVP